MSTQTRQIVRPAGAGHETLYVLLTCLLILAMASAVIGLRGESHEPEAVASHQLDARRDLNAAEQGIYADLRVSLDEARLLAQEQQTPVSVEQLAEEGLPPFVQDVSATTRGAHQWQMAGDAWLGLSQASEVAGSFLLRNQRHAEQTADAPADIWINRNARLGAPSDLSDASLIAAGWKQVVSQFDAGVTRQHRH